MYPSQVQRLEAIRKAALQKLRSRPELQDLPPEQRVQRLVEEALAESYDDPITANYEWDFVERTIRRAIADSHRPETP